MKLLKPTRGDLLAALAVTTLFGILFLRLGLSHPVAWIRVVHAAGQPLVGAVLGADGLRPKAGPFQSGHYAWRREATG